MNRAVSVTITTDTDFTTGFRVYAVAGSPTGTVVDTAEVDLPNPPGSGTVTFQLPAGTYYFDWADRLGDGVTYTPRHSTINDFYAGLVAGTETHVAECVIPTTTTAPPTTTTTPPTTAAPTTVTAAAVTTTTVLPTTTTRVTTTTAAVSPVIASTTAVPQTAAAVSANTLPATGSNNTPLIAAGVAFLGLGTIAVLSTRRQRPAHER